VLTLAQKTKKTQKTRQTKRVRQRRCPLPPPQCDLFCCTLWCSSPSFGCSYSSTIYCCSCIQFFISQPRRQCVLHRHSAPWLEKRRRLLLPPRCCGGVLLATKRHHSIDVSFVGGEGRRFFWCCSGTFHCNTRSDAQRDFRTRCDVGDVCWVWLWRHSHTSKKSLLSRYETGVG